MGRSVLYSVRAGLLGCLTVLAACSVTEPTLDPSSPPSNPLALVTAEGCPACAFGPQEWVRLSVVPEQYQVTFAADPLADYIIDIDDLGTQGSDGSVTVNGAVILANRTLNETGPRHVRQAITLAKTNVIVVRLTGKPGSKLRVTLLGGTELVGREGGVVRMPGGAVVLDIPAGALLSPTEISVVPMPGWASAMAPPPSLTAMTMVAGFELLPRGLTFVTPATVTFRKFAPEEKAYPVLAAVTPRGMGITQSRVRYNPAEGTVTATLGDDTSPSLAANDRSGASRSLAASDEPPSVFGLVFNTNPLYETYPECFFLTIPPADIVGPPLPVDNVTTIRSAETPVLGGPLPAGCTVVQWSVTITANECTEEPKVWYDEVIAVIDEPGDCPSSTRLSIGLRPAFQDLIIGDTKRFEWIVVDNEGGEYRPLLTNDVLFWRSDATEIAALDAPGVVRAISAGETIVNAFGRNETSDPATWGQAIVAVYPKLKLVFEPASLSLSNGEQKEVEARIVTLDGTPHPLSPNRPRDQGAWYSVVPEEANALFSVFTSSQLSSGVVKVTVTGTSVLGTGTVLLCVTVGSYEACGELEVQVSPAVPPKIVAVTPPEIVTPSEGTTIGTITAYGQGFAGGELYTTAWIVLEGGSQVSADGTTISRTYKVGPGAVPGDYKMMVVTPRGVAEYPITQRNAAPKPPPRIDVLQPGLMPVPSTGLVSGTIVLGGEYFANAIISTSAPILLLGQTVVSTDAREARRDFQIGAGAAPGSYKIFLDTPSGHAEATLVVGQECSAVLVAKLAAGYLSINSAVEWSQYDRKDAFFCSDGCVPYSPGLWGAGNTTAGTNSPLAYTRSLELERSLSGSAGTTAATEELFFSDIATVGAGKTLQSWWTTGSQSWRAHVTTTWPWPFPVQGYASSGRINELYVNSSGSVLFRVDAGTCLLEPSGSSTHAWAGEQYWDLNSYHRFTVMKFGFDPRTVIKQSDVPNVQVLNHVVDVRVSPSQPILTGSSVLGNIPAVTLDPGWYMVTTMSMFTGRSLWARLAAAMTYTHSGSWDMGFTLRQP